MILSTYKNISINLPIIYRVVRTLLSGQVGNLDIKIVYQDQQSGTIYRWREINSI